MRAQGSTSLLELLVSRLLQPNMHPHGCTCPDVNGSKLNCTGPHSTPRSLAGHVPAVQRCIGRALPRLDRHVASGEPLDLTAFLGELTLSIVGEVAYG